MAHDHRRLAAIVSLDVVGYSRLMGIDESGTLAALKAHRRDLIDPKIAEHDGRIVKTTGDGLLLDFPSVVDAVRCAVEVQRGMAERNAAVPAERRIQFRIGINLGDIIIDGDDIFGDGVNVAARLQAFAEPGTICVGRAVRDQVLDKLGFAFEDLGAHALKNIARPIEVFRIRDDPDNGTVIGSFPACGKGARMPSIGRAWGRHRMAAALLVIVLAGAAAWQLPKWWPLSSSAPAPAFSVAVMPFTADSGSLPDAEFAGAVREGVLTALASFRFLKTASERKVRDYQATRVDTRRLGRDLNVRYLLDGQVRATGDGMEVSAHLTEAESGADLWSGRLTTGTASRAEAASNLARRLSSLAGAAVYEHELQRAVAHPRPGNTVDLVLQFDAASRKATSLKQRVAARKFLDEALRIDPDFLPAREYLANLLDDEAGSWELDRAARASAIDEEDRVTLRTVRIDESAGGAWADRAQALVRLGRWDQALAANAKARSIVAGRPDVAFLAQQAWILDMMDRPEEALAVAQRASSIPPDVDTGQEGFAVRLVCLSQLLLGRYAEAVAACESSAARDNWWVDHMWLAAGYAQLGDSARAAAEAAIVLKMKPGITIARLEAMHVGSPANLQRTESTVFAGLRKAGVPER